MKSRILSVALPIVILVSAIGVQSATTDDGEEARNYDQAHTAYKDALDSFKACVEAAGLEVDLKLEDNQVFYSLSYGSPGVSSLEEREELDLRRDKVHEACSSPQLTDAVSRLEAIVTPSDARLRDIASECAIDLEIEVTTAELNHIASAAPADPDLANCIQARVAEDVEEKFRARQGE